MSLTTYNLVADLLGRPQCDWMLRRSLAGRAWRLQRRDNQEIDFDFGTYRKPSGFNKYSGPRESGRLVWATRPRHCTGLARATGGRVSGFALFVGGNHVINHGKGQ